MRYAPLAAKPSRHRTSHAARQAMVERHRCARRAYCVHHHVVLQVTTCEVDLSFLLVSRTRHHRAHRTRRAARSHVGANCRRAPRARAAPVAATRDLVALEPVAVGHDRDAVSVGRCMYSHGGRSMMRAVVLPRRAAVTAATLWRAAVAMVSQAAEAMMS